MSVFGSYFCPNLFCLACLSLIFTLCSAQLIGHRGVFRLPPGAEYRDEETRTASEGVSAFARKFQPLIDLAAELNKFDEQERTKQRCRRHPVFVTNQAVGYSGKMKADLFYYSETWDIDTDPLIKKRILQNLVKASTRCVQNNNKERTKKKKILKIPKSKKYSQRTFGNPFMKKNNPKTQGRRPFVPLWTIANYTYKVTNHQELPLPGYGRSG